MLISIKMNKTENKILGNIKEEFEGILKNVSSIERIIKLSHQPDDEINDNIFARGINGEAYVNYVNSQEKTKLVLNANLEDKNGDRYEVRIIKYGSGGQR